MKWVGQSIIYVKYDAKHKWASYSQAKRITQFDKKHTEKRRKLKKEKTVPGPTIILPQNSVVVVVDQLFLFYFIAVHTTWAWLSELSQVKKMMMVCNGEKADPMG